MARIQGYVQSRKKNIRKKRKEKKNKKEISTETWVEEKEEEGRDQTHDFSSAILFFRSQLNGARIFFFIVALIIINCSSYPWS